MNANALTRLIRAAAIEAAEHRERFAAEDVEARKIVEIMETFLRVKGRVVYGGAAINAHMPADQKFYDPTVNLPDYDFLTPDPLQDCADLIVSFQEEGFTEVEAKFGIHEGTYKVFVNFRAAADITFMPEDLYGRLAADSVLIDGIRYASPDYLRMNMYLELSRPAGDVSRWEKVYKRLLLLNELHPPMVSGSCPTNPLAELGQGTSAQGTVTKGTRGTRKHRSTAKSVMTRYNKIVNAAIENHAIFLSGASYLAPVPTEPDPSAPVLLMSATPTALKAKLTSGPLRLRATAKSAIGELLPARTEFFLASASESDETATPVAVVFETVACHAYTTLADPDGYRLASLDTLIQMYYALAFTGLAHYVPGQIQCVILALIDIESQSRLAAAENGRHNVFPLECIGHQPTLPELKRAHRDRVRDKKAELIAAAAAAITTPGTTTSTSGRRHRRRTTQRRKKASSE